MKRRFAPGVGGGVAEAARKFGLTEQTYHRWKREYGGLWTDQVKRLKDLENEIARLKRLLADAELDKAVQSYALLTDIGIDTDGKRSWLECCGSGGRSIRPATP